MKKIKIPKKEVTFFPFLIILFVLLLGYASYKNLFLVILMELFMLIIILILLYLISKDTHKQKMVNHNKEEEIIKYNDDLYKFVKGPFAMKIKLIIVRVFSGRNLLIGLLLFIISYNYVYRSYRYYLDFMDTIQSVGEWAFLISFYHHCTLRKKLKRRVVEYSIHSYDKKCFRKDKESYKKIFDCVIEEVDKNHLYGFDVENLCVVNDDFTIAEFVLYSRGRGRSILEDYTIGVIDCSKKESYAITEELKEKFNSGIDIEYDSEKNEIIISKNGKNTSDIIFFSKDGFSDIFFLSSKKKLLKYINKEYKDRQEVLEVYDYYTNISKHYE